MQQQMGELLLLFTTAAMLITQGKSVLRKLGIRRYHNKIIWAAMTVIAAIAANQLGVI